jgi:sugar lactone lactonase YvrE
VSRAVIPSYLLLLSSVVAAQQYVISTVAGGAPPLPSTVATSAPLDAPFDVATDGAGNLYFTAGYCVFKVDGSGVLTRIAGNRRLGYSGDGGLAASANMGVGGQAGLLVDGRGNLLVSDITRVRRISPSGIISTIAGTGAPGLPSGDGGPATAARLSLPEGLAMDGQGNLYIADWNAVRKVSPAGIITTVAGTGKVGFSGDGGPAVAAQLSYVSGLALDQHGSLYIADSSNRRVRRVAPDGTITTVAGGGAGVGDGSPAIQVALQSPSGVAVDGIYPGRADGWRCAYGCGSSVDRGRGELNPHRFVLFHILLQITRERLL